MRIEERLNPHSRRPHGPALGLLSRVVFAALPGPQFFECRKQRVPDQFVEACFARVILVGRREQDVEGRCGRGQRGAAARTTRPSDSIAAASRGDGSGRSSAARQVALWRRRFGRL